MKLPHPHRHRHRPARQSCVPGNPAEGFNGRRCLLGESAQLLPALPELPPLARQPFGRGGGGGCCARPRNFDGSMVASPGSLLSPLARNWRHGPLKIPKGSNPSWCSATPQFARLWTQLLPQSKGRPQVATFARSACLAGQMATPSTSPTLHPPQPRPPTALTTRAMTSQTPRQLADPAQERPDQRASTCASRFEFSIGSIPGSRNMPLSRAAPHPLHDREPLCWFCQSATQREGTGELLRAGDTLIASPISSRRHRRAGSSGAADPQTPAALPCALMPRCRSRPGGAGASRFVILRHRGTGMDLAGWLRGAGLVFPAVQRPCGHGPRLLASMPWKPGEGMITPRPCC